MPERKAVDGQSSAGLSQTSDVEEIFFIFHARDETEPHQFIKYDPLYQQGCVKKWEIQELDMVHKERDDELLLTYKF